MKIIKLKRPPCARFYVSIVSVSQRSIESPQAYQVNPHSCGVGTAEVDSVNHANGVNHGKDWDYAPINVTPWSFKIFND